MKARFEGSQQVSDIRNPLIENLLARLHVTKEKMLQQVSTPIKKRGGFSHSSVSSINDRSATPVMLSGLKTFLPRIQENEENVKITDESVNLSLAEKLPRTSKSQLKSRFG
jgi:hypothetical protein